MFGAQLPECLRNLTNLKVLNLANNVFSGNFPSSISNLTSLTYLSLYANYMKGFFLLSTLANHSELENLYISSESIGAHIETENIKWFPKNNYYFYTGKILESMTGLDLSCNKLIGIIPSQIGDLQQIRALNLSHNYLSGPIPITFSNLTQIESLDLSYNNLSGKIPYELTQLNFLSNFNVSYNNFSGTPPNTGQFGDFDEQNYKGNPGLCGPLLNRKCVGVASPPSSQSIDSGEKETKVDMISFYWSFGASYITILLSIITVLYINAHWRMAWFYFMTKIIRKCFPNFPILY